ncbi:hypothetical protein EPN52_01615 [bacterium]|nr:MAG: hypothetical protein EPN52_01615 [bacterium]
MNGLEIRVKNRMGELLTASLPLLGLEHSSVSAIISGLDISHDRVNGGRWTYHLTSIFGGPLLDRVSIAVQATGRQALQELLMNAQTIVEDTFARLTAANDADPNSAYVERFRQQYADAVSSKNELNRQIGQGF